MTEGESARGSRYYQGVIRRLFRGSERGVIRSLTTGRETEFDFRHVIMRGPLQHFADLSEGMDVGFDVGWTSSGLRITIIRTGDLPPSEGETGAEEQVAPDQLANRSGEDGDIE